MATPSSSLSRIARVKDLALRSFAASAVSGATLSEAAVAAAAVAATAPPPATAASALFAALDEIQCEDVALDPSRSLSIRDIEYLHIYGDSALSIGIFVFPPSACIPLHDHPEMTVLSRVLYGGVHVRSFDWAGDVDEAHVRDPRDARPAVLVRDAWQRGPCTMALGPRDGNIHAFTADPTRGCAILDVIAPPYSDRDGRSCHYFAEMRPGAEAEEKDGAAGFSFGLPKTMLSEMGQKLAGQALAGTAGAAGASRMTSVTNYGSDAIGSSIVLAPFDPLDFYVGSGEYAGPPVG